MSMYMSGHCCLKRGVYGVSLTSLLPRIKGEKSASLSLFSIHRRAHIQTVLLNRFLANTSCVDRRDELLFLLQLAEGTEPGPSSKRAATVEATKPADLLLLPLPTHTHTHTCKHAHMCTHTHATHTHIDIQAHTHTHGHTHRVMLCCVKGGRAGA